MKTDLFNGEPAGTFRTDIWRLKAFLLSVLIVTLCLSSPISNAYADGEWAAALHPAEDTRGYGAEAILTLQLPELLAARTGNFLTLEIDNVDVTELMVLEGGFVTYQPFEFFAAGEHTLRLYEILADGTYMERTVITFQTFTEDTGSNGAGTAMNGDGNEGNASFYSDNSLEVSHRLFDKYVTTTAEDTTLSGSGNIGYQNSGDRWNVEASSNYFIESEEDISMTGRRVDMGEYNLSVDYRGDTVNGGTKIGHHDMGVDSFAMSGFNRRGVSVSAGSSEDTVKATAFSFASDSIVGASDIVGTASNSGHVRGGLVSFRPKYDANGKIEVSAVYFSAIGGIDSTAVSGDELDPATPPQGHGDFSLLSAAGRCPGPRPRTGEYREDINAEYNRSGNER